jgi:erythromycin esterase
MKRQRVGRDAGRAIGLLAALVLVAYPGPARAQGVSLADWIRRTAQPFATCAPREDRRDLAPLRRIVGDAHVVALGEGTVGTSEFVQLKHRIVEYLATDMGFTTVAIAANMPETRALDAYIQTGRGDPRALISGLKYWHGCAAVPRRIAAACSWWAST